MTKLTRKKMQLKKVLKFTFFLLQFQIREQCEELILTDEKMEELMKRFMVEINRGLSKKTHKEADIRCYVTYVQDLPNGTGNFEQEKFTERKILMVLKISRKRQIFSAGFGWY